MTTGPFKTLFYIYLKDLLRLETPQKKIQYGTVTLQKMKHFEAERTYSKFDRYVEHKYEQYSLLYDVEKTRMLSMFLYFARGYKIFSNISL